jgi:hypothetical protein
MPQYFARVLVALKVSFLTPAGLLYWPFFRLVVGKCASRTFREQSCLSPETHSGAFRHSGPEGPRGMKPRMLSRFCSGFARGFGTGHFS